MPARYSPEKIAYWFFRLNGCFTFENFIVHPDERGGQRTDADLIALRFSDRCELRTSGHPMQDHGLFDNQPGRIAVYFVEVKAGRCKLNGPWTNPERENLPRVLNALGVVPASCVSHIAADLYHCLRAQLNNLDLQFVALGRTSSSNLDGHVPQLTWPEVLGWIYDRFHEYPRQKEDHRQWAPLGKNLYSTAIRRPDISDKSAYVKHWLQQIGVRPEPENP